jgi:ribosome biogenesis GTPase / thiamine phosphate phosphatase
VESLTLYGWGPAFADQPFDPSLLPGRVVASAGDTHTVHLALGSVRASEPGRRRFSNPSSLDRPTVGDWVGLREADGSWLVEHLFVRSTSLVRKKAGRSNEPQVVAANVDTVFVVTAATAELNPRRLERYLAAVRAGGATPVILLNKVDLVPTPEPFLERLPPGVAVHAVSALEGIGLEAIQIGGHRTYAFVGSSGVGKSTIVNAVLGDVRQRVHGLARDDTGRHTTTHRELFRVADREALVIDTPGMRELGLWSAAGLDETFADVEDLAGGCRFRDCGHDTEPGCAVQVAIEAGELEPGRLVAWRKLLREARRAELAVHVKHAAARRFARSVRHRMRDKYR